MKNLFKTIAIAFAVLGLGACNDAYLEEAMEGTPVDTTIADKVNFDGVYAGEYPAAGYFSSKEEVAAAVNTYLKGIYTFCDEGSTANVAGIQFGTVTTSEVYDKPFAADETYTLVSDDYKVTLGQKYNNFNDAEEAATNLATFLAEKYADYADGKTLTLTYEIYKTGTVSTTYKRVGTSWEKLELDLNLFNADINYTLTTEDYDAMGTDSGEPGKYDNFDNKNTVNFYIPKFLAQKYPYEKDGAVVALTYKWYAGTASDMTGFWRLENGAWVAYDPYTAVESVVVETKTAQCTYDGSAWVMSRLVGGSKTIALANAEYEAMYTWVLENKGEQYNDTQGKRSEYYSGASSSYNNINNKFSTWRKYYNDGDFNFPSTITDEDLQLLAEERLAEVIMAAVLPVVVTTPDSGLIYNVVYTLYGDGTVQAQMSFMYNDADASWECLGRPLVL
ncbi:MAG: hypothetical protein IJF01_05305 [Tidjanibacter sp.]|nr:hypothetical protein [Tidjanibacter sp.]